jgi:hypothetical protein
MSDEANRRFARAWKAGITIERYIAELENKYDGASKLALERETRAATAEHERDEARQQRDLDKQEWLWDIELKQRARAKAVELEASLATVTRELAEARDHVRKLTNVATNWCRHSAHCDCNACETVEKARAFVPAPPVAGPAPASSM